MLEELDYSREQNLSLGHCHFSLAYHLLKSPKQRLIESLRAGFRNRIILDPFCSNTPIIFVVLSYIVWIVEFTGPNTGHTLDSFLCALTKLREVAISFVMSVHKEQRGFHWTDFHEI